MHLEIGLAAWQGCRRERLPLVSERPHGDDSQGFHFGQAGDQIGVQPLGKQRRLTFLTRLQLKRELGEDQELLPAGARARWG